MRVKLIAAPDHRHCSNRRYHRDPQICFVPTNTLDRVTQMIPRVLISPVYLLAETMVGILTLNWMKRADRNLYSIFECL